MILGSPGKVGRCQIYAPQSESFAGLFFCFRPAFALKRPGRFTGGDLLQFFVARLIDPTESLFAEI